MFKKNHKYYGSTAMEKSHEGFIKVKQCIISEISRLMHLMFKSFSIVEKKKTYCFV